MRRQEVEAKVYDILDRFEKGEDVEDSDFELKTKWPVTREDYWNWARLIAAHANFARGENILWIVGVDEKNKKIVGVSPIDEIANWYPQIEKHFDDKVAPKVIHYITRRYNDLPISALYFSTDDSPYVIKTLDDVKRVDREVPWREATTGTRSAKREELLKILLPIMYLPKIVPLKGDVRASKLLDRNYQWNIFFKFAVYPRSDKEVVIPVDKCEAYIEINKTRIYFGPIYFHSEESPSIINLTELLIIESSGMIDLRSETITEPHKPFQEILINGKLNITIPLIEFDSPISINTKLLYKEEPLPKPEGASYRWLIE